MAQLPARLAALLLAAGFLNTFLFSFDDRERRMDAMHDGWGMGRSPGKLLGVDWNRLWGTDLADLRRQFNITTASQGPVHQAA